MKKKFTKPTITEMKSLGADNVVWFFLDENQNIVNQTIMSIKQEKAAIDALSVGIPHGKYTLGYMTSDGTKKIYENSHQIV